MRISAAPSTTESWSWWTGCLFAGGSLCFAIGPFPGYVQLVGQGAAGATFFAGSILFTSAALLQLLRDPGWATGVQLAGTLFFNLSTFGALTAGLSTHQENRVVWAPDVFGSACFLVASWLAWTASRDRVGAWNLCGSFAFGIAAAASYVVPKTGDVLALAPANLTTVLGALCFLAGSLLLLPPVRDRR